MDSTPVSRSFSATVAHDSEYESDEGGFGDDDMDGVAAHTQHIARDSFYPVPFGVHGRGVVGQPAPMHRPVPQNGPPLAPQDCPATVRAVLGLPHPEISGARGEIDAPNFRMKLRATGGAEKVIEMDKKIEAAAGAIFERTKELIVEYLNAVTHGGIGFTAKTIKIEINYTTQMATWTDKNGIVQTLDLTDTTRLEKGAEIKNKMQEFMTTVSKYRPHGGDKLSEYKKMIAGPASGRTFFTQGVNGMGSSLESFAKNDLRKLMKKGSGVVGSQDSVVEINKRLKAMATVDLYKRNLVRELKQQIANVEADIQLAQGGGFPKQPLVNNQHDLKILKETLLALEGAHNEALYAYIAVEGLDPSLTPGGTPIQKADRVEQSLRSYLVGDQKIDRKWGGFKEKEGGLERKDDLFIKGVGALALPAVEAVYGQESYRAVFNQYIESKEVHSEYGTGIEGSFLLIKALQHHTNQRGVAQEVIAEGNMLIIGDFKDLTIGNALTNVMAKTEQDVVQLHAQMDALAQRVQKPDAFIKQSLALIKAA